MARLVREEKLGGLPLQLASGKRLTMGALRGSSRVVIFAGTHEQVRRIINHVAAFPLHLISLIPDQGGT